MFITPRVIRNPEDARDVSEELRSRLRSLRAGRRRAAGRAGALRPAAAASSRRRPIRSRTSWCPRAAAAGPVRPVAGTGRLADAPWAGPATALLGALLGLCVGSFVGTLALREPDGWRGLWCGRSQLPRLRHARWPPVTSSRS